MRDMNLEKLLHERRVILRELAEGVAKQVIVNNDMCDVTILIGDMSIPTSQLKWRREQYVYQEDEHTYSEEYEVLTLDEIASQLKDVAHKNVITVWAELPLSGTIYQYNNYEDNNWHEHGNTRGYA